MVAVEVRWEHLGLELAVEVWQGTLGADGRGWSWLRSGG